MLETNSIIRVHGRNTTSSMLATIPKLETFGRSFEFQTKKVPYTAAHFSGISRLFDSAPEPLDPKVTRIRLGHHGLLRVILRRRSRYTDPIILILRDAIATIIDPVILRILGKRNIATSTRLCYAMQVLCPRQIIP